MKAAVVHDFAHPPQFEDYAVPIAEAAEQEVHVRTAALSRLVRSQAEGKHYSSGSLPMIPGVDGVGRLNDGSRVYFAFPRAPYGSMAELTVVPRALCVPVPADVDDVTAAAIANPGMSSWAALRMRAHWASGEGVLINGATGVAGRLAIQIAKHLGASKVVATGRNAKSIAPLHALGADSTIPLDQPGDILRQVFRRELVGVGVVLDYLWGPSAEALMAALSGHGGAAAEPRVRYVQIGNLGGESIALPASHLRSSGLEIMGSGLGSVAQVDLVRCIGELLQAIGPANLQIAADPVPLSQITSAWSNPQAERQNVGISWGGPVRL